MPSCEWGIGEASTMSKQLAGIAILFCDICYFLLFSPRPLTRAQAILFFVTLAFGGYLLREPHWTDEAVDKWKKKLKRR
jgi:hypothetical protein